MKRNKALKGFGKRLKVGIKNKFRFQKDFAKLLNVTENTLSRWIKGKTFPDNIETLINIAKILDMSLDWLILGKVPLKLEPTLFNKVTQVAKTWVTNNKGPITKLIFTNIYKSVYKDYKYNKDLEPDKIITKYKDVLSLY